ncbi:MAG: hypothetical protein AAGC60_00900 [Acidobacteriota bacterium]
MTTHRHQLALPSTVALKWVLASWLVCSVAGCAATPRNATSDATPRPSSPITIRWTTASEVDNYGFHVYRGLDVDGPFERLTRQIIAGAGTTDLPRRYAYEDRTARPGETYYYWVETVSLSGVRRQLTPIQAAKAPDSNDR